MNFGEALEAANKGKHIKVSEWNGYWFKEDGIMKVKTHDGNTFNTPHFQQYIFRTDWEIVD